MSEINQEYNVFIKNSCKFTKLLIKSIEIVLNPKYSDHNLVKRNQNYFKVIFLN